MANIPFHAEPECFRTGGPLEPKRWVATLHEGTQAQHLVETATDDALGRSRARLHPTKTVREPMPGRTMTRRRMLPVVSFGALGTCAAEPKPGSATPPNDAAGTVANAFTEIQETQPSLTGSVAGGSGTLTNRGVRCPIRVRGPGVGGIGLFRIGAIGDVDGLKQLDDFPSLFGEARTSIVIDHRQASREMRLENPASVRMHLNVWEEGLALQIGADGVLLELVR
jgi:hypothetical protein